jgi:hypothetical protein
MQRIEELPVLSNIRCAVTFQPTADEKLIEAIQPPEATVF